MMTMLTVLAWIGIVVLAIVVLFVGSAVVAGTIEAIKKHARREPPA